MGIEEINIEADGFVTKDTDCSWGKPLEQVTDNTANPTTECCYPRCEECKDYVSFQGANYCTVPMVITKQIWRLTADLITDMERRLTELEELVTDEILGGATMAQANNTMVCHNCIWYNRIDEDFGDCIIRKRKVTPNSYCNKGKFKP